MKSMIILFTVSLILLLTPQNFPQGIDDQNTSAKEACVKTLLEGINSDNHGLMAGCAYMLGEICCDKSVIKLLGILHDNPSEELRILAALSLYKIGDSRGLYAIKQAIRFDESERVSKLCEKFYKSYLRGDTSDQIDVAVK